jgi:DNA polymerase lambda
MFQIMEIIQTGGLRRIAFENTGDVEATKIFTGIYGVGQ